MASFIAERLYHFICTPEGCSYNHNYTYIASSLEDAISMCREEHPNNIINEVKLGSIARRRSTKTVSIKV